MNNLKLICFDFDGVFTDGTINFDNLGKVFKSYNVKDGKAISLLRKKYEIGVISSFKSNSSTLSILDHLNIKRRSLGCKDKLGQLESWCEELNITHSNVAFMGDDLNDVQVMKKVGLSVCPNDAVQECKNVCDIILKSFGGKGAIRELCDILLEKENKILCCIPARYKSTRLPGKPLLKIDGKTIINHVYEKAMKTQVDKVVVLTDDQRIYDEVVSFGGECFIVVEECLNGSERIAKYLNKIDHSEYDVILNLQGDEPFINVHDVDKTIENYYEKTRVDKKTVCSTMCFKTHHKEEILSKSRGKAITDLENNIIYCSRNVIPSNKKEHVVDGHLYNIHVGVFVFRKEYLLENYIKGNTPFQLVEDIEWLKIIEQGYKINTIFVEDCERGVDTIDDYDYLLKKYN